MLQAWLPGSPKQRQHSLIQRTLDSCAWAQTVHAAAAQRTRSALAQGRCGPLATTAVHLTAAKGSSSCVQPMRCLAMALGAKVTYLGCQAQLSMLLTCCMGHEQL